MKYVPNRYGNVAKGSSALHFDCELQAPKNLESQSLSPIVPPTPGNEPTVEPRRSNLLTLLNDTEPEEPRRKKPIEQGIPPSIATQQKPRKLRASCDACSRAKVLFLLFIHLFKTDATLGQM
jgi:hypothetical protein